MILCDYKSTYLCVLRSFGAIFRVIALYAHKEGLLRRLNTCGHRCHGQSAGWGSASTNRNQEGKMRRKSMMAAALAALLAAGNVSAAYAGWQQVDAGAWKYQNDDQSYKVNTWYQDTDGKWYHFNQDGIMDRGWFLDVTGIWYHLGQDGSMDKGWYQDTDGKWYFLANSGAMQTGLASIDGQVYYFNPSGELFLGEKTISGRSYIFGLYGVENGSPSTSSRWYGNGDPVPAETGGGSSSRGSSSSGGSTNPGGTEIPGEGEEPGGDEKPGDDGKPGEGEQPGEDEKPGEGEEPGEDEKPGEGEEPGEDEKPGGDEKPGEGEEPGGDEKPPVETGDIIETEISDISGIYTGTEKNILLKVASEDAVISAVSSDGGVVSAEVIGNQIVLKAISAGTAVITVNASAEGYEDQELTFTVTVENMPVETEEGRLEFNFNTGWKFSKGVGRDNSESEVKPAVDVVVIPETEKPWELDYEMGDTWTDVSLPHTYNDVDTFDNFMEKEGTHHGERSMYTGTAWYKKEFTVPESFAGKKVFLEFEAARQAAHVYLNGELLEGVCENGFIPFGYDLTPYLNFGGENQITVMVDNSFPYYAEGTTDQLSWHDSHWHPTHGGLYRNANLYVTDKLHVTLPLYSFLETQGVYVYTADETEESATVYIEAEIQNEYDEDVTFYYEAEIEDMDGGTAADVQSEEITLAPGEKTQVKLSAIVDEPILWSDQYPYQYKVVSHVVANGEEVDTDETNFGIRIFRFTNDYGMYLNENYLKLQGWGQKSTNEWAGLGAAYPDWMHDFVIKLMKDAGGNFIRWGHTAGSPTQIGLSDKYGLIVEQPGVDGEGSTVGGVYSETAYEVRKNAFRDMLIYYRNSPSIFMWELGNQSMPDKEAKALSDLVALYDHHGRGSAPRINTGSYDETTASSQRLLSVRRGDSVMAKYVDVGITTEGSGGMNTTALGKKPEVEGEYNREEARRGVWDRYTEGFENYKMNSGTYNLTTEEFAVNQVVNYKKISAISHSGGANWIFSDSTSHGRVYSEVTRASGEVDAVMLEKEAYYALKTIQTDDIDAYIIGHWNYTDGTVKPVYVTSDADSVELFLNGESLGKGVKTNTYLFTFSNVAYEPGTLEAVGYDMDGVEVCRTSKATHGEPAAVRLTPIVGPQGLLANGSDILLIDAEVVDDAGNRCLNYDGENLGEKINFEINDENGCSIWRGGYNSGIEHSTNEKSLYIEAGITRVAVRTTTLPGTITVTGSIDGLASDTISEESQEVDNVNGMSATFNETMEYSLDDLTYPGMGDGTKPEAITSMRKGYTSLLVDNFSYSGTDTKQKPSIVNPAAKGKQVYTDDDIEFGDLPLYLVNEDYFQLPNVDTGYAAEDMVSFGALQDINVYVAHDDRIMTPEWLEGEIQGVTFADTDEDIEIDGQVYSLYLAEVEKGTSVTLSSNAETPDDAENGNMYVVFVTAQGHEDEFFEDDFEMNTEGSRLAGWNVVTGPDTSVLTVSSDGGKAIELYDTNTQSEDNLAYITKEFLPQTGKFSVEWKLYDKRMSGQNYVRFVLNQGSAGEPGVKDDWAIESYLNTNGNLVYRSNGSSSNNTIKSGLASNTWHTIKYVVDVDNKTFDAYVNGELVKENCGFYVPDVEYISCLIIGTGQKSGTDIMVDDVKIEVLEDRLESITVNGEVFADVKADENHVINLQLPEDFDQTQTPLIEAAARDYYAEVELTQAPADFTQDAVIRVTPLSGDSVDYTVKFGGGQEEEEGAVLLEEDFEGFDADDTFEADGWTVWADESKNATVKIAAETTSDGENQVLHLLDNNKAAASTADPSDNMALISGAFTPQTSRMAVEYKIKDQLSSDKRFFRIILHNGEADKDPNAKDDFLIETYVTEGKLVYRDAANTGTNKTIGTIKQGVWYTIKYVIDIENETFDVYMDGTLVMSDIGFRNKGIGSADHIIFATGGKYTGDFLLDDIAVYGEESGMALTAVDEQLVGDILIDGKALAEFSYDEYDYEVEADGDAQQIEVEVATASNAVKMVTINDQECEDGTLEVDLEEEETVVTVDVEAEDGYAVTYTITVMKAEKSDNFTASLTGSAVASGVPSDEGGAQKPDMTENADVIDGDGVSDDITDTGDKTGDKDDTGSNADVNDNADTGDNIDTNDQAGTDGKTDADDNGGADENAGADADDIIDADDVINSDAEDDSDEADDQHGSEDQADPENPDEADDSETPDEDSADDSDESEDVNESDGAENQDKTDTSDDTENSDTKDSDTEDSDTEDSDKAEDPDEENDSDKTPDADEAAGSDVTSGAKKEEYADIPETSGKAEKRTSDEDADQE